jgi:hypothetical protein
MEDKTSHLDTPRQPTFNAQFVRPRYLINSIPRIPPIKNDNLGMEGMSARGKHKIKHDNGHNEFKQPR